MNSEISQVLVQCYNLYVLISSQFCSVEILSLYIFVQACINLVSRVSSSSTFDSVESVAKLKIYAWTHPCEVQVTMCIRVCCPVLGPDYLIETGSFKTCSAQHVSMSCV